ncbi:MAG: hypothetical protein JOZ15_19835, partial [Acidobacteria bacterium]|nr:hypothetical protein [Acidobacteriota bacterium]
MRAISRPFSRSRAEIQATLGRALALAAAALLGLFLVAALPEALQEAWSEIRGAARDHESLAETRSRVFGESYTRAIDEIRRSLPAGESYLIVDGGSGS